MSPAARLLRLLVVAYRSCVSPLLGPHCRFAPTCSAYALEAVTAHGALRGSWLALRRVARCHPFHPGGLDPVPPPLAAVAAPTTTRACHLSEDGGSPPGPAAGAPLSPARPACPARRPVFAVRRPSSPARRLGAPS